jgi:hypothetical protein
MKEKITSLETEVALLRKDVKTLYRREPELPKWLKNSAIGMLAGMFLQIMTMVWWAATMDADLGAMKEEVRLNTEFRMDFPKLHQEVMVELAKIETRDNALHEKLSDIKSKLKYVGKNGQNN